jgi:hypothetical protein
MNIHLRDKVIGRQVMFEYDKDNNVRCAPIYVVPTYEMAVEGVGTFEVVRFGLGRSSAHVPPPTRDCNRGIFRRWAITDPIWDETYSPQTREGTTPGGLRLWPHDPERKHYLIHEGPEHPDVGMGTNGCVEVLTSAAWRAFVAKVAPAARSGAVRVETDPVAKPVRARSAIQDLTLRRVWGAALHRNLKGNEKVDLTDGDVERILTSALDKKGVTRKELSDLYLILYNYEMSDGAGEEIRRFLRKHGGRAD